MNPTESCVKRHQREMASYLLDTTVLIDTLNDKLNRKALLIELVEAGHILACCPINIAEVHAGMRLRKNGLLGNCLIAWSVTPSLEKPPAVRVN